ncbi:trypsin-like serine peptidase [Sphingomonas lacusdianchii]|uniref:trypsin-like serine peptidase n=1 Tax=Sphingomonas lacusdianchii TaxID=2917992 RepID=UPI001F588747|nr:serine protease [Sphingomonas sp. JXJ CY 53]
MLEIEPHGIRIDGRLWIGFERTLRLPNYGKRHPLPAGLGALPIRRAAELSDRLPEAWRQRVGADDILLPLHDREALFVLFVPAERSAFAVKVAAGGINAVSGAPFDAQVRNAAQDYLVCPPQAWLDGINSGDGTVRQFVATRLGSGQSIEGQLSGSEDEAGVQFLVFPARPELVFESAPAGEHQVETEAFAAETPLRMGLAAGGELEQKIYPDPYGADVWSERPRASFTAHLVHADDWAELTGTPTPPTPITRELYRAYGLPWFELADAHLGDVPASPRLASVRALEDRPHPPSETERQAPEGGTIMAHCKLRERLRLLNLENAGTSVLDASPEELLAAEAPRRASPILKEAFFQTSDTTDRNELPELGGLEFAIQEERRAVIEAGQRGIARLLNEGEEAELTPAEELGAEAIIQLTGRPAILIQQGRFFPPPAEWQTLEPHRASIEALFKSVGRIEVEGHPDLEWVGTGFLVGDDVIMTNRHVATEFTSPRSDGRWGITPGMKARIDFAEELGGGTPAEVRIKALIGIHGRLDMALFRLDRSGGGALPPRLPILSPASRPRRLAKRQVYVVGYPAWDGRRNDPEPMQRLFGNIFNVKRLQPGEILGFSAGDKIFTHDCSTLGGNSGSCVVDLETHQVLGLHFGGRFREANHAVALWELQNDPLIQRAGIRIG